MKSLYFSYLFAVLLTSFVASPVTFAEEAELFVEGIIYESKTPTESMAIVNGVLLKKGDIIRNYKVKEVKASTVIFVNKNGQEKIVSLLAAKPKSDVLHPSQQISPSSSPSKKSDGKKEEEEAKSPFDLLASLGGGPQGNKGLLDKLTTMGVMVDLKNIQMVAMQEYMSNGTTPASVDALVKQGILNPAFEKGVKGNYKFSIDTGSQGPVIHADPIEGKSQLSHFMLDEWGNLRSEKDKKATSKSPIASNLMG